MILPRALRGPVYAMARPARPAAEAAAVAAAADLVRAETGIAAVQPLAREIARRVVAELLADLQRDPFEATLAVLERGGSPVVRLATCPEIDTVSIFVQRRVERLEGRGGRYLTSAEQSMERRRIAGEVEAALEGRYARCLRASDPVAQSPS